MWEHLKKRSRKWTICKLSQCVAVDNLLTLKHICLRHICTYSHIYIHLSAHIHCRAALPSNLAPWKITRVSRSCLFLAIVFKHILLSLQGEWDFFKNVSYPFYGVILGPQIGCQRNIYLATRVTFKMVILGPFVGHERHNKIVGVSEEYALIVFWGTPKTRCFELALLNLNGVLATRVARVSFKTCGSYDTNNEPTTDEKQCVTTWQNHNMW